MVIDEVCSAPVCSLMMNNTNEVHFASERWLRSLGLPRKHPELMMRRKYDLLSFEQVA